jgi:hypothetical protein
MIREATKEDFPVFLRLWLDFLEEQREYGSEILPTPRTVNFFSCLFVAYTTGARRGVVLLNDDNAVLMYGEGLSEQPYDTDRDPAAHGWGVFVKPECRGNGLSGEMYDASRATLSGMGFKTMVAGALLENRNGESSLVSEGFGMTHTGGVLVLKAVGSEDN